MPTAGQAHEIGVGQVGACAALLLVVIAISATFKLGLSDQFAIAATRTVLQLLALAAVLDPIFSHNEAYVVLPYIGLMICFAAREASVKPKYCYSGMARDVCAALLVSLGASLGSAACILRFTPWWNAQYVIPIAGMILGNAVSAVNLGLAGFLTGLVESPAQMDALLACGATRFEAVLPSVRAALLTGLTPTINQMSVIGLVSIPGMMTGNVLAGSPPLLAAKYQVTNPGQHVDLYIGIALVYLWNYIHLYPYIALYLSIYPHDLLYA